LYNPKVIPNSESHFQIIEIIFTFQKLFPDFESHFQIWKYIPNCIIQNVFYFNFWTYSRI